MISVIPITLMPIIHMLLDRDQVILITLISTFYMRENHDISDTDYIDTNYTYM